MLTAHHIHFLQEKIEELKTALFFSMSAAVLKMPTTIINAIKVDAVGQVWFVLPKPKQYLHEFDHEFPARLDFFRKGKNFFLKVQGKACIITDPEELTSLCSVIKDLNIRSLDQQVLVKVRVQQADYFDNTPPAEWNWLHSVRSNFRKWIFNAQPGYRPYRFEPDSMMSY